MATMNKLRKERTATLIYRGAVYRLALPYQDEGFVGERWGRQGSGLLLTTGTHILLLHRSQHVKEPGSWGVPGGAIPIDDVTGEPDDTLRSALRESEEELGSVPQHRIVGQYVYREPSGFSYTTFIGAVTPEVAASWRPELNWENDDYGWFSKEDIHSMGLHFGVMAVLQNKLSLLFPRRRTAVRSAAALQVVDFRLPDFQPTYPKDVERAARVDAFVMVGKSKIFLFNYADGNTLEWGAMLDEIHRDTEKGTYYIVLLKGGNVLLSDAHGWGAKSRFSRQIVDMVQPLHDAGLVLDSAKVWLGNWASLRGRDVGTVKEFLKRENLRLPDHLTLYHGTSNKVGMIILREGIKAQPVGRRIWHKDVLSRHPEWRGSAVYLTVDQYQAHYYATKAANVLRRHGHRNVSPWVLKVTVPRDHFDKFLPDDDYLASIYGKKRPDVRQLNLFHDLSWLGSLGEMSQVAYLGHIPPDWISIESMGVDKRKFDHPQVAKKVESNVTMSAAVRYRGAVYRRADKMGDVNVKRLLQNAPAAWQEALAQFPEGLVREILVERPQPTTEDIEWLLSWRLQNDRPVQVSLAKLLENADNQLVLTHLPAEVTDAINTKWGTDVKQSEVYDRTPERFFQYAKLPAATAKPSVLLNGEIIFGVGRFVAALLRGDETLKVWDIRSKQDQRHVSKYMSAVRYRGATYRRASDLSELASTLPEIEREVWNDGTVVVWRKAPFPVASKPYVPSKLLVQAPLVEVPVSTLRASQSRVTQRGIERWLATRDWSADPPIVIYHNGLNYIQDGHHRLTAAFLRGDKVALVRQVEAA